MAASVGALARSLRRCVAPGRHVRMASTTVSTPPPLPQESFLSGTNVAYLEALYEDWEKDPDSVHPSMRVYFENAKKGNPHSYVSPPEVLSVRSGARSAALSSGTVDKAEILDNMQLVRLMRAYQSVGHTSADLDPLGIFEGDTTPGVREQLTLEHYGLEDKLDKEFALDSPLMGGKGVYKLRDIHERLKESYQRTIGWDFMHIQEIDKCNWLRERIESPQVAYSEDVRRVLMVELIKANGFEQFLAKKYGSEKRFGVDGCESLIPGMNRMVEHSTELGVEVVVLGMPHRGRLNVLHNVMKKPMQTIFSEFMGNAEPDDHGSGDVKYHLGLSTDVEIASTGKAVHLELLANPSHLEAVNPVVAGRARAEQFFRGNKPESVLPVLLHGDAAFSGQGVVYETMGMTDLSHYSTGGMIHIVVNNQIGFTTDPRNSRSTPYCTDIAKSVGAPILHVNGDDVEAVVRCFDIAVDWRQHFKTDVVIDIVCYRRHGHNEGDNPSFTQPLMYQQIAAHPRTRDIYAQQLVDAGVVTQTWLDEHEEAMTKTFDKAFNEAKEYTPAADDELGRSWRENRLRHLPDQNLAENDTGVTREVIAKVGEAISNVPDNITVHPALSRLLKARKNVFESDSDIDWAVGESLAYGSILAEGMNVRLSGQDVERGTFSHRHHVIHCQVTDGLLHYPLDHLGEGSGNYSVSNSHLSEFGVLGFELGYSMAGANQLVLWEAQFGDFANTAQCIIDQFLAAGEAKWGRQSGLVLLLPHGYEGMGPEHSSARLERFLQMSNDDEDVFVADSLQQLVKCNWQVVNPTTPANMFHVLRRQLYRPYRKPLVVMTPKSLLRHPLAKSPMADLLEGTSFQRVLPETDSDVLEAKDGVRRLILCSGKVYYELLHERRERGANDVALVRLEQISPFPFDLVQQYADEFPNAEIVFAQEEPRNMGAWSYVAPRLETTLRETKHHKESTPLYIGRKPSASTAAGDKTIHKRELTKLMNDAFHDPKQPEDA
eukprot:m.723342 g.723342  ORF g.723342 m.723342 type:complete len:999 (-) comp23020_c0_seq1:104-3100(-)